LGTAHDQIRKVQRGPKFREKKGANKAERFQINMGRTGGKKLANPFS